MRCQVTGSITGLRILLFLPLTTAAFANEAPSIRDAMLAANEAPSIREAMLAANETPSIREAMLAANETPSIREAMLAANETPSIREAMLAANEAWTIHEEMPALGTSPPQATVVREFLRYLFTPETDLAADSTSRARWLTPALYTEFEDAHRRCAEAAAAHPDERYDLPGNSSFYDAWDPPTTFRMLGSRVHRTLAFVDVEFAWGVDTNYPGDRRVISYVLALTDGSWKVDDVVSVRGTYASPGSLSASLRAMPE